MSLAFGTVLGDIDLVRKSIRTGIAGIVTFFLAGIRPKYWWEEQKARKYTFQAAGIWFTLLIILTAIVIYLNL